MGLGSGDALETIEHLLHESVVGHAISVVSHDYFMQNGVLGNYPDKLALSWSIALVTAMLGYPLLGITIVEESCDFRGRSKFPWIITRENCSKNRSRTLRIFAGGVYFRVRLPVFRFLSGLSLGVLRFNFRFPEVFRT
jgi:hypothetical protein